VCCQDAARFASYVDWRTEKPPTDDSHMTFALEIICFYHIYQGFAPKGLKPRKDPILYASRTIGLRNVR
jgi:hypothetical protein